MMEFQCDKKFSPVLLIHYGEIALKGGNRRQFEDLLIRNISAVIEKKGKGDIRRLPGRICVDFDHTDNLKMAVDAIKRVFGVANICPGLKSESSMHAIEAGTTLLIAGKNFSSFAIRTRRSEKKFPIRSVDVNTRIGALVQKQTGARVDLDHPETAIGIEILNRHTFLFCDRVKGPGGLPVGIAGRVACLISGGIDSPVAAWRMMKRGCLPVYIHFHSAPFTSAASIEKVRDLVEHLSYGLAHVPLLICPFGEIQQKIVANVPPEYRVVIYRRFMLRIAEALAREEGALALVTGEALSQVASQTLSNMAAIDAVAGLPILRPLVGLDKQEIVDEAKHIGTYETACEPHDDCCSFLIPKHPATRCTAAELDRIEQRLDVAGLVTMGLKGVSRQ